MTTNTKSAKQVGPLLFRPMREAFSTVDKMKACPALLCLAAVLALTFSATPAFAEGGGCPKGSVYTSCSAGWEITSHVEPTNVPPGHRALIQLYIFNVGALSTEAGKPITVTDVLPEGVIALKAGAENEEGWNCTGIQTSVVRCTNNPVTLGTYLGAGAPPAIGYGGERATPYVSIEVMAGGTPRMAMNRATVVGGGTADAASTTSPVDITETSAPFAVANWDVWFGDANGKLDTQAGSHPYSATFDLELDSQPSNIENYDQSPASNVQFSPAGGELRNVTVDLPPGFVGNPTAVPQCPRDQFDAGSQGVTNFCPPDTVIGFVSTITVATGVEPSPIYNLVPPPGVAAQFGFSQVGNSVFLDSGVKTGGDNGIVTQVDNAPQGRGTKGAIVTLWGDPGDPSHDPIRCTVTGIAALEPCASGAGTGPLLTLPTACAAPQPVTVHVNSWQDPNLTAEKSVLLHDNNGTPASFTGCEQLSFNPTITTDPDTTSADTPAGLTVEVQPPLGGLTEGSGLSTSDIQNTTVTLPEGLVINPGQAAGLQACQPSQDGLTTEAEQVEGKENDGPASCPNASKVGTVTIKTPLIEGAAEKQFEGDVYILQSNPPELKLLVAASADGVNLKLVGVVHLNEQTGQLTTKFEGTPELPFTDFKLSFSGGARAALDTPTQCGAYTTNADFGPWSSPFVSDILTNAQFAIAAGPGGGPCPSAALPFSPSLTAGSTTDQAGGYTDFSMLLQRGDDQQRIERLQFKVPEGLSGMISKVPLCTNAQAEANACPAASKIGHTVVESGPGPYPLVVPEPGQEQAPIYLTESYDGAPFGLSIVVPLHVGPFTLPTQRVRAKIEVDPHTAQITVTTDPLPQVVAGVPTDLREIDAVIDHPEFMFNPTNCNASSFSGTAWGAPPPGTGGPDATAAISSNFGVGSCQSLKFAPKFSVSTPGKTSKADGAGLSVKLSYPAGSMGTQANIARVKVDLPKQLPSRLTTLQKACTNAQFEANPAGCPSASKIGMATVTTPLLPVPLAGPAIFVSHGGEAFPSLIMVLQGYGVTVDLVGTTFISKAGITSSTFKAVPDVPFSTFELVLPEGKYSALAANGNLCASKLAMPTEFLGQNGLKINESTNVVVTGCAKKKAVTRAQKLAAVLKTCRKKAKGRRAACESTARKRYGPVKAKKKK
jgi:hypothetical protein